MNSGGGMMNGNSTGGGMMGGNTSNGNMMDGNGTKIDCSINGNNSTTMINSLHQQHIHHPAHWFIVCFYSDWNINEHYIFRCLS